MPMTRDQVLDAVWAEFDDESNVVDMHIGESYVEFIHGNGDSIIYEWDVNEDANS